MTDHVEPWCQTVSGVAFDLLTPRAEDVKIDDIATALCRINRYAGHTLDLVGLFTGYSVAQHSVLVSEILETWGAPLAVIREGLLHDAPEAYYGDVSSPVQRAMRHLFDDSVHGKEVSAADGRWRDPFTRLKLHVDPVVRGAFGLPVEETPLVKRADLVALACERASIMAPCSRDWKLPEFPDRRWRVISPQSPIEARQSFMQRLAQLDAQIQATAEYAARGIV